MTIALSPALFQILPLTFNHSPLISKLPHTSRSHSFPALFSMPRPGYSQGGRGRGADLAADPRSREGVWEQEEKGAGDPPLGFVWWQTHGAH